MSDAPASMHTKSLGRHVRHRARIYHPSGALARSVTRPWSSCSPDPFVSEVTHAGFGGVVVVVVVVVGVVVTAGG